MNKALQISNANDKTHNEENAKNFKIPLFDNLIVLYFHM